MNGAAADFPVAVIVAASSYRTTMVAGPMM
jgi:hypothetical protein